MSSLSKRYTVRLADENDAKLIEEILSAGNEAAEGAIGIRYLRKPDVYASLRREADKTVIALVIDNGNGRACAMGCAQLRETFVNNAPCTAGYCTLLKIIPEYRGRLPVFPQTFSLLFKSAPADVYYATILEKNTAAQRLLEKPRDIMPAFTRVSDYTVYCFKTRRKPKSALITEECGFETFEKEFAALKNKPDLCTVPKDCGDIRYYRLLDGGSVKALCGVINQQSHKQYAIAHYKGVYKFLSKLPLHIFGYPRFPKAGHEADYASVCSLCFDPSVTTRDLRFFIKSVGAQNAEYDFLMLGCTQKSRINEVFRKIKNVQYKSFLYAVGTPVFGDNDISLDVGFL